MYKRQLLEGRIGDYSEKIAACNIKDALYVVISTQSDFPGSSLDIALYAQIKELLNGMEPEVYLAQGIDIISCILCFNAKHSPEFCEVASLHPVSYTHLDVYKRQSQYSSFTNALYQNGMSSF